MRSTHAAALAVAARATAALLFLSFASQAATTKLPRRSPASPGGLPQRPAPPIKTQAS